MKLTKIFGIVLSLHVGVILLVMFQPSCQTADKKQPVETPKSTEENTSAFNEGLDEPKSPNQNEKKPLPELKDPTRPVAGELFVPGNNDPIVPAPLPTPIVEPINEPGSINLKPTDLKIYKIVNGDTLWGIAKRNNLTLQALLDVNPSLNKNSRLNINQEIMLPKRDSSASQVAPSVSLTPTVIAGGSSYTVVSGDNLSRIARKNGVSLQALITINGINSNSIIRPGQVLVLPEGSIPSSGLGVSNVIPDGATTHIVKRGENLTRIASLYGTTVKQVMEWNNIQDAGKIKIGQNLVVSSASPTVSPLESNNVNDAEVVPADDAESSLQNFFQGEVEEKPVIDVPE